MKKKKDCIFCNREKIKENILFETKNFYVKVGINILAPGHIMIISKDHLSCFGELPNTQDKEFFFVKNKIFNKVNFFFSEPIVCEHGVYSQSVEHAHMHFIPKKNEFYSLKDINKKIFSNLESKEVDDIFEIKNVFKKDGSYFYLEEDGRKWIFTTKGLPNQKFRFRREFARLIGIKELSDWENIPEEFKKTNEKWIKLTKEKLKDYLKNP